MLEGKFLALEGQGAVRLSMADSTRLCYLMPIKTIAWLLSHGRHTMPFLVSYPFQSITDNKRTLTDCVHLLKEFRFYSLYWLYNVFLLFSWNDFLERSFITTIIYFWTLPLSFMEICGWICIRILVRRGDPWIENYCCTSMLVLDEWRCGDECVSKNCPRYDEWHEHAFTCNEFITTTR